MSLFAGTSFLASSNDKTPLAVPDDRTAAPAPTASVSAEPTPHQSQTSEIEKNGESSVPVSRPTGTGQAAWSAALRFAPAAASRRSKPAAKAGTAVNFAGSRIATTSTSFSAAPSITALPNLPTAPAQEPAAPGPDQTPDGNGKKIFRPPSMTLDAGQGQSQNEAFTNAMGGKKRPFGSQGGPSKKKKWRKNKKQFETPHHVFIPDEAYNPAKPNDLQEYRDYRKAKREERRERERAEKEERERRGRSWSDDDDEEDEYSEEEVPRRDAPRAFAPPSSLYAPPSEPAHHHDEPTDHRPPVPAFPALPPVFHPTIAPAAAPLPIRRTETADEAYARRLAMSTGAAVAHNAISPTTVVPQAAAVVIPFTAQTSAVAPPPTFVRSVPAPVVDLTRADPSPAPTPAPAPAQGDAFQKALEARRLAAETIAKRLAADYPQPTATGPGIGTYAAPSGEAKEERVVDTSGMDAVDVVDLLAREVARGAGTEDTQGTFAERMMRKMGHVQGQGLGRTGDGIVHALAAEHAEQGKSKKPKTGAGGGGWVHSTSAKGRLVNANQEVKQREERARYGEPSRVVCLVNVMGSVEEADAEMMEDLGEKLKEHGIVERLVPHAVYPPPSDPMEAVRIFVVFSGPAGAWKALKDLDGRFFGGRQIAAKFFDEKRFDRGDWDGPILRD